jgi:hypothetical protein
MNKDEFELTGITSDGGTVIAEGPQGLATYALLMWRAALALEIKSVSQMVASRNANAKTIIPQLVALRITEVPLKYTASGTLRAFKLSDKVRAYQDLNAFLVSKGAEDRTL